MPFVIWSVSWSEAMRQSNSTEVFLYSILSKTTSAASIIENKCVWWIKEEEKVTPNESTQVRVALSGENVSE